MEKFNYLSADGKTTISAYLWRTEGKPKGVVQIIHGMSEYAERYAPFAEYLTANGYAVCAEDHPGHGGSVNSKDDLGYFGKEHDYNAVLADIRTLHLKAKEEYPGVPYYIMGHSMGSFFCRVYISRFGGELAGSVIMGTGFKGGALMGFAKFLTRLNAAFCGWRNRSKFIYNVAFGSYNKRFKGEKEANSWLSVNRQNVAKYNADGLCGFYFTNSGYYVLFSVIGAACSGKTINAVPKSLPVIFVAGEDDPVGDYGKGVQKAYNRFKKAGVKNVDIKLYKGARHEILNEAVSPEVMADLLEFFNNNPIQV